MKNRQYTMEDFRRGGLAVAIRNSKERDKFLRLCEENGIRWCNDAKATEYHSPQAYPYAIVCDYPHGGRLFWRSGLQEAVSFTQIAGGQAPHYRVEIDCADGKTTVARLLVDGREVKRREARRSPADTFSLRKGAELAFARLWDKQVKPEKKPPAVRESFRNARAGDWVKIVLPCLPLGKYHRGDILQVQGADSEGNITVEGVRFKILAPEYVVLEGYEGGAAYEAD